MKTDIIIGSSTTHTIYTSSGIQAYEYEIVKYNGWHLKFRLIHPCYVSKGWESNAQNWSAEFSYLEVVEEVAEVMLKKVKRLETF